MPNYILSNDAEDDLIRICQYGVKKFGMNQADKYFDKIAERSYSFEAVDSIKSGYRRCVCGVDSIYLSLYILFF